MIFHQFPDLEWLKNQAEKRFSNKVGWEGRALQNSGWPTVILNVKTANIYRDNIRGPLSIFTNLAGESAVMAENRRISVKEDFFFVTNRDQRYTLSVDKQPANTFNIHFGEEFAEGVIGMLSMSPDFLLDNQKPATEQVAFHNRLHRKSPDFNNIVKNIHECANDKLFLEENLVQLMTLLLKDHSHIRKVSREIPSLKKVTREEIVKRLLYSVDYVYANYNKDLSLDDLAKEACLSKFHFLRLFKIAFRKTPHQYIAEVRTDKARLLLKNSKEEVSAISRLVGFKDSSSFSRMFFNQVGVYPTQYRAG
jgi:AraC family transcriptional regulator